MLKKYVKTRPNIALLVLRLGLGAIFVMNGFAKYNMGIDNVADKFAEWGIPAALTFAWIVMLVEIIGGAALIFGVASRYAALLLSVVMVVAILAVKIESGLVAPEGGGFQLDLALLVGLISVLLQGPGKYSIEGERG